jgi:hypothetical protein
MLLNGKRSRIKRDTEEVNIRHVASPGLANWETQQLGGKLISHLVTGYPKRDTEGNISTNRTDGDGRVSEKEELVHAGNEDSPNETDDPSTEGR